MKSAIIHILLVTTVLGSSITLETRVLNSDIMPKVTPSDPELNYFTGSCTLDIPGVFKEGEMCATIIFDDATYGLTTEDTFQVLERKDRHGTPTKTYRFTNSEKITAGNVQVNFMSWRKTNVALPKYACKLESTSTSSRYQDEAQLGFAKVVNFETDLTTTDGVPYNMLGNFQGTCTFDERTDVAPGELVVAVISSIDTYGIQVGDSFQVLFRDVKESSPQTIYRITNSKTISSDQLKIGFMGWYNVNGAKPTYYCKPEAGLPDF